MCSPWVSGPAVSRVWDSWGRFETEYSLLRSAVGVSSQTRGVTSSIHGPSKLHCAGRIFKNTCTLVQVEYLRELGAQGGLDGGRMLVDPPRLFGENSNSSDQLGSV